MLVFVSRQDGSGVDLDGFWKRLDDKRISIGIIPQQPKVIGSLLAYSNRENLTGSIFKSDQDGRYSRVQIGFERNLLYRTRNGIGILARNGGRNPQNLR